MESGTQKIKTKRLRLRRLSIEDAPTMFKNWTSDAHVVRYLTWEKHQKESDTEIILEQWLKQYQEDNCYRWGIEFEGELIGMIDVVNHNNDINEKEIGYVLSKDYWNKGIMSEALSGVIDYLFKTTNVNRICSRHDPRNIGSGKVMLKSGMLKEGTLRDADRNNQGICDMNVYAILRKEREI